MSMQKLFVATAAFGAFVAVQSVSAAPATFTGKISDAMCGADHKANGGTMAKDAACVASCVKGGSSYVFVNDADHKVYKIANQKVAGLAADAGKAVTVTGEVKEDSITVSKVALKK